jgi:hypothetical protein
MKAVLRKEYGNKARYTVFQVSDKTRRAIAEFPNMFKTCKGAAYEMCGDTLFRVIYRNYDKLEDGSYVVFFHSGSDLAVIYDDIVLDNDKTLDSWRRVKKATLIQADTGTGFTLWSPPAVSRVHPLIQYSPNSNAIEQSLEIQRFIDDHAVGILREYRFTINPLYPETGYLISGNCSSVKSVSLTDYIILFQKNPDYQFFRICQEHDVLNNFVLYDD